MVMNPSDPRISEWLDGRLSKQEAAEIELLVRSDRHLLRDVEEIRAARILLATVAKLKVAPDFSQSVMAAIARGVGDEISDPTGSPDLAGLSREDRGIEEEWRSIERQRVAAEIDEAKEDVGSSVLSAQHSDVFNVRSRWLIVPLSTALAGGLLVAFAINAVLMQSRVDPQIAQQNEKQPSQIVSNETLSGRIPSAELSDRLAVALADDEQHVRIVVRDTTARLQLESLIAASGMHVELQNNFVTDFVTEERLSGNRKTEPMAKRSMAPAPVPRAAAEADKIAPETKEKTLQIELSSDRLEGAVESQAKSDAQESFACTGTTDSAENLLQSLLTLLESESVGLWIDRRIPEEEDQTMLAAAGAPILIQDSADLRSDTAALKPQQRDAPSGGVGETQKKSSQLSERPEGTVRIWIDVIAMDQTEQLQRPSKSKFPSPVSSPQGSE